MRQRTIRLPLERPDDETWKLMRAVACKAARFGNLALADMYAAKVSGAKGKVLKQVTNEAFKRSNDELSGWVRGAMMQNRVRGYWRRSGRDVLAGRERLACFSADRALTISADQRGNKGALYEWDGDVPVLVCRFEPVQIRDDDGVYQGKREPTVLRVAIDSPGVRKDRYIREAIEMIWSGAWLPGTITFRFDRRRRKIDALVSCSMPDVPKTDTERGATLGPYKPETGELWLRFDDDYGAAKNYAHRIHRMLHHKEHHMGIVRRLRRRMGRDNGRRQVYRRKLRELGDYADWARDRMHELSAEVVQACRHHGVSELRVAGLGEDDLPWHALAEQLAYKCDDGGIEITTPDAGQDATYRAKKAEISKRAKTLKRAKDGLAAAKELVGS